MHNRLYLYSLIAIDKITASVSRYHRCINCATKAFNMKFFHFLIQCR